VITELNKYIDYIQNDVNGDTNDGGSGYTDPNTWVNTYKTGTLLYQMKMVGDTAATPRVKNATNYIEMHWNDLNQDPGWRDFVGSGTSGYQGTFSLLKGLDVFGITQINVSGNPTLDLFDDMATEIVNEQKPDGHWGGCTWGDNQLCTVWALLTIEKAVTGPQPECSDGIDNDGDGLIDMADPGCTAPTDNSEVNVGQPQCSDGIDNDGDGLIDMADPGCTAPTDNSEVNVGQPQCSDGIDNDGDGLIDFPADPGCSGTLDDDETDINGIPEFPTVALPIISIIGIIFVLLRKKI